MICPFRKCQIQEGAIVHEYFEDCYQEECPYYVPEQKYSNIIKPEHCMKALHSTDGWQKYSDELWKNAYERGKQDALNKKIGVNRSPF